MSDELNEKAEPYPPDEEEYVEKDYDLPEAGGVVWTDLYTPKGQKLSVTARGKTVRDAIDAMNDAVFYAHEKYGWVGAAQISSGSAPAGRKSTSSAPKQVQQDQDKQQIKTWKPPEDQVEGEAGYTIINKYQVSKAADGRGVLETFSPGLKFPSHKVVFDIASLSKLLGSVKSISGRPWQEAIETGEVGNVSWLADWTYGKEKPNGKGRYENVTSISER